MKMNSQHGSSLVEMLLVILIMVPLMGCVFQLMNLATSHASTEQTKLDMFQEAREFMDQMSRDLRQAGYPNVRDYVRGEGPDPEG